MIIAGTSFCTGAIFQASAKNTVALLFIGRVFWGIGMFLVRHQDVSIAISTAILCFSWDSDSLPCRAIGFMSCHTAGIGFGDHCAFIYTAEMAPPRWRGRLNTLVQLGTIGGIVVANAINIGTNNLIWGWRLSLGLAAVPGLILLMGELIHAI